LPAAPFRPGRRKTRTSARIVIAGAGAAGLAAASHLARLLEGAKITLIDARKEHFYQPGFTLVASGIKPQNYVVSSTAEYVPQGVELVPERVAEFDPESNKVVTESGMSFPYDYLIVATGLKLDYAAIPGMDEAQIGKNGLGSIYHSPAAASATWQAMSTFADQGGVGVFLRPGTEMKCAGAPLQIHLCHRRLPAPPGHPGQVGDHLQLQQQGPVQRPHRLREGAYAVQGPGRQGQLRTDAAVYRPGQAHRHLQDHGRHRRTPVRLHQRHPPHARPGFGAEQPPTLEERSLGGGRLDGSEQGQPAPRALPQCVRGRRHRRGTKGKTAASVKWQVPVAVDHLVADIAGKQSDALYTGYTSCPLITRLGQAMLVEFDYENNLTPSFPGVIAPLEELWISWVIKTMALKPTYISMLRGRA